MIKIIKYTFCVAFVLTIQFIHAQDARMLLVNMNKVYSHATSFSMGVRVKVFEAISDTNTQVVYNGNMKAQGNLYYSELMGKTTLVNRNCFLLIDEENQVVLFNSKKPSKVNPSGEKLDIDTFLDSTLFKNAQVKIVGQVGDIKKVEIIQKDDVYTRLVLSINLKTFLLTEVVYYLNDSEELGYSKLIVSYSDIKLNRELSESFFSEKQYIEKRGGKIVPVGKCAGFTFVDQSDFQIPN